jgi:hypothetical protein
MVKRRNPQDSTLRNVRAAHKKIETLTRRVRRLEERVRVMRNAR